MKTKKTNVVILWLIAIGLVLGMILTFTPNLGLGGTVTQQGEVVMRVNGEPITDLMINQVRNSNPIYYAVTEGEVGADLELLAIDAVITQELLRQAAAPQRVSNAEVRDAVNTFRADRGLSGRNNDTAYLTLLAGAGFDDAAFRSYLQEQLRQQKWEAGIIGDVSVSDEEVETFYEVFKDNYRTDERIIARAITVADQELANEIRTRVLTGESFADLAAEHSLERADRGGALGASAEAPEPQPTGRAAMPTAVSNAAFNLRGPGLTSVITAGNNYWLVQVEEYIAPTPRPFEEVRETVREDALTSRQVGLVSAELERLLDTADIQVVADSGFRYSNTVVARVGDEEIRAADLARATYGNAEVQQFLDPSLSFLITQMLKPQILEQMIDQTAAAVGAGQLDGSFFGTQLQIAQQALEYVARDVEVSDEEIEAYYNDNLSSYTQNAEAQTLSYEFSSFEEAESFRAAVLAGSTPTDAAIAAGVEARNLGLLRPGLAETAIDAALFGTDAFEQIDAGGREISDVLFIEAEQETEEAAAETEVAEPGTDTAAEDGETAVDPELAEEVQQAAAEAAAAVVGADTVTDAAEAAEDAAVEEALEELPISSDVEAASDRYVVLVALRTAERVRPLAEVRDLVADAALAAKRSEVQNDWLADVKAGLDIENLTVAAFEDPFLDFDFSPEDVTGLEAPAEDGDAAAAEEAADGEAEEAADDNGGN